LVCGWRYEKLGSFCKNFEKQSPLGNIQRSNEPVSKSFVRGEGSSY